MYDDSRLKIQRADKHIADLNAAVATLPNSYRSTIEVDRNIPAQSIKYDFPQTRDFLRNVALVAGDAIHNLKTALDYAWMETIMRLAPAIAGSKFAKFPVRKDAAELEAALRGAKVDISSPPLFNCVLSQIKPYPAANCLLVVLHDLDIADKHRLLLPLTNAAGIEDIEVEDEMGQRHKGGTWRIDGAGPYYVSFRMDYKIHNKGQLIVQVVLGDGTIFKGLEIADSVETLAKVTVNAVDILESVHNP